jgi:hypothetical protein
MLLRIFSKVLFGTIEWEHHACRPRALARITRSMSRFHRRITVIRTKRGVDKLNVTLQAQ